MHSGCGYHWLLAIANFREQEISVFNSNHSLETVKLPAPTLMKVISCMEKTESQQEKIFRLLAGELLMLSMQDNGYDCGVFVVVNTCAIINHSLLGPVNSLKARLCIHSLIQKYEAPKSKRSGLLQVKLLSYNKKVQTYETVIQKVPINTADYTTILQRLQMICKHSKDWTLCSTTVRVTHSTGMNISYVLFAGVGSTLSPQSQLFG